MQDLPEDSQEKIKIKEEAKLQFYPCNYEILSSYVKFHPFSACVSHTAFFFFFFFWQYSQHSQRFTAESPSVAGTPPKHEPKNTSPVFPLINAFLQEEAQVNAERHNIANT